MKNLTAKIENIKAAHKGFKAELINKVARMISRNTGMNMMIATAFAKSQI